MLPSRMRWSAAFCLALTLLAGAFAAGCKPSVSPAGAKADATPPPGALELVFTYSSEKEEWIQSATAAFHRGAPKLRSGQPVHVAAFAQGSGECLDEAIEGTPRRPHLTSPASEAYVRLGNARWRARSGGKDLLPKTDSLVLSPVVIAMWRPMAEALGWPGKPVGWADILALARDPQGWAARGQAQWGRFKFGHTHPEYSNSGLMAVLAEAAAASGRRDALTPATAAAPATAAFVAGIEQAVVHYGTSSGFFARKMFANGPSYLSAAVLYESNVVEANDRAKFPGLAFPVVAIYPREGTFWADHPAGIVEREWTTDAHREAARLYLDFLLSRPQQQQALALGFRPSSPDLPVAAPVEAARGADPREPQTTLPVPGADGLDAALALWRAQKKTSAVTLVMDTSGSMKGERIRNARLGGAQLVANLGDRDLFSLLTFSNRLNWDFQDVPLGVGRNRAAGVIGGLIEGGGTALYDAILAAHQRAAERQRADPSRIAAVVVLTDGEDTDSRTRLDALLAAIRFDPERQPVRVFTIGYGEEASEKILRQVADATQGRYYKGTPQNIASVFKDIATFF